jgi:hypothetical protein
MSETWTVTIDATDGGTGKVTISCTGATCSATWNSTDLRDALGFTGNLSGSTSYTSTNQAEGLWLPDCAVITPYDTDDAGTKEYDFVATESPEGHVKALVYTSKTTTPLVWPMITNARCRTGAESTTNESFQTFNEDVLMQGETYFVGSRFRWYPDADTDGTYTSYALGAGLEKFAPEQVQSNWTGLWRIIIPRAVQVP